jgi:RNA polymerase II subunit A C-terminal domain phosphatase
MNKSISLGHRIRYPITNTKLLKQRGDEVKKQEPLMQYSFKWMKKVGDAIRENEWEEEQTTIADWDSPAEGELREWRIKEGDVITHDQVCLVVKEACGHEIQFQGLCAICGKDMTEVNWAAEQRDTDRAPINMTHDQTR